jgi:hypothetical protein
MGKLNLLKVNKLLKELDYIESDFEYRNEIIKDADSEFINSINSFLEEHPDLKEIYDKNITDKINESIKKQQEDFDLEDGDSEEDSEEDSEDLSDEDLEDSEEEIENKKNISQLKKLYREIVKLTHPDKIKNKKLNDFYIKATEFYNDNNKIGLYKICNELDIEFEIDINDDKMIEIYISSLRGKIHFLESTFTWKWFNSQSEQEKNQIILNYIKLKLTNN